MDSGESKRSGSSDQREDNFPATPMVLRHQDPESDISLWDDISDYVQGQISGVGSGVKVRPK